jgi:dihydrofolate synthase/folylpolyglutamate synthase
VNVNGPATLADWLAHCARFDEQTGPSSQLHMQAVWKRLGIASMPVVVSVLGTNGKSSTAAMLEAIALQAGYRVGLVGGAPLMRFEERCRIGAEALSAEQLLPHFEAVEAARQGEALAAEVFILLVLLRALASEPLDLIVIEVALGESRSLPTAVRADCSVVTNIDVDPSQFPSDDRERIGFEIAQALSVGQAVVVGDPRPPTALLDHARSANCDLRLVGRDFHYAGDRQQWSWAGQAKRFNALAYPALRGVNQLLNAAAALAAFELVRDRLPITAQSVRNGLAMVELPGRFQIVPGQPTLVLDIAHNDHAAATLVQNLDQMAFHPRTQAVFGSLRGHDVGALMRRLAPVVDTWRFVELPLPSAIGADELRELHARLELRGPGPVEVHTHADALEALDAAVAGADPADRIVVFGSVAVVAAALAQGVPRMPARHAG